MTKIILDSVIQEAYDLLIQLKLKPMKNPDWVFKVVTMGVKKSVHGGVRNGSLNTHSSRSV
jgi:hypothetical protein